MSSRTCLKFALGDCSKMKWSKICPRATSVLENCLSAWDDKDEVLTQVERWTPPTVSSTLDQQRSSALGARAKKKLTADYIWAATANVQVFKALDRLDQLLCSLYVPFGFIAFTLGSKEPIAGDCVLVLVYCVETPLVSSEFQFQVVSEMFLLFLLNF